MASRNRTAAMTERALNLLDYLLTRPEADQQEVMNDLKIKSPAALYRLLLGLAGNPSVCSNGEFNLTSNGLKLTVKEIEEFLDQKGSERGTPIAERLLYLYNHLFEAIPYGGVSAPDLLERYTYLLEQSGSPLPTRAAVRRSLQRDLERLEMYGIQIERPATGSKKYCLKQAFLPKLSPESTAVLYVSTLLHRDTLLTGAIDKIRNKMESSFYKGMVERARLLKERIHVLGDTLANPEQFESFLGLIFMAVSESFQLSMDYINNEGQSSARVVEPLGLVCKRGVWYLIARQADDREIRTFRVDQVQHLVGRELDKFEYPPDFSIRDHIGSSWGVYCNDPDQTVCIRFSKKVAQRVKNLHYHPSQQIMAEEEDGSIILQFQVCGLIEMQSWLLQWGSEAEVLEPQSLRKNMARAAKNILRLYNK